MNMSAVFLERGMLSKADRPKVESITIEKGGFKSDLQYWVELNKGFCFDEEGCHCFGEDSQELVRSSLKRVRPCHCSHYCCPPDDDPQFQ